MDWDERGKEKSREEKNNESRRGKKKTRQEEKREDCRPSLLCEAASPGAISVSRSLFLSLSSSLH